MIYLLDVSVVIALVDRWHVFYDQAHEWFARTGAAGWATCPIVQNGLIRIIGHPRYLGGPGTTAAAGLLLRNLVKHEGHRFWPDDISLVADAATDPAMIGSSTRVTDTYLLALAVHNGGRLATLDRRLSPAAVRGGREALHVID